MSMRRDVDYCRRDVKEKRCEVDVREMMRFRRETTRVKVR